MTTPTKLKIPTTPYNTSIPSTPVTPRSPGIVLCNTTISGQQYFNNQPGNSAFDVLGIGMRCFFIFLNFLFLVISGLITKAYYTGEFTFTVGVWGFISSYFFYRIIMNIWGIHVDNQDIANINNRIKSTGRPCIDDKGIVLH